MQVIVDGSGRALGTAPDGDEVSLPDGGWRVVGVPDGEWCWEHEVIDHVWDGARFRCEPQAPGAAAPGGGAGAAALDALVEEKVRAALAELGGR